MRVASAFKVGASNTSCTGASMPHSLRMRETSWVASRESPPSSKKWSSCSIEGRPNSSRHKPAMASLRSIGAMDGFAGIVCTAASLAANAPACANVSGASGYGTSVQ